MNIVSVETCDIVAMRGNRWLHGGGGGVRAGASVVVCEKFASSTAHGIDIGAVGTKVQKAGRRSTGATARLIYEWGSSRQTTG